MGAPTTNSAELTIIDFIYYTALHRHVNRYQLELEPEYGPLSQHEEPGLLRRHSLQ